MVCVGGKYQLLGKLGSGGTSSVYLAVDNVLHKKWAVKETSNENLDSDKKALILQSLRAEVEVLNHCNHPSIPRIVDFFEENGRAYAVRDYVEGSSLKTIIAQSGVITPSQVCALGIQLCELLQYLHSLNPAVVYCDLKPSNVMISNDSSVHLIDFGSALELKGEDGVLVQPSRFKQDARFATCGFAAPELFEQDAKIGVFTDVYALGATLFYALTGTCYCESSNHSDSSLSFNNSDFSSFSSNQTLDFKDSNKSHPLTNFDLSCDDCDSGVRYVLMRALAHNPKDRYEDCAEFSQALKDCLEHLEFGEKVESNMGESGLVLRNKRRARGAQTRKKYDASRSSRARARLRVESGNQNIGKRHKKNGVKNGVKNGKKNIFKIVCCVLMAFIGCVVFVFACKSVITNASRVKVIEPRSYVKSGNISTKNKHASNITSSAQEYKKYMVKAAKSADSKQIVEYVNKAMFLQVKLFNANVQPMSIQPALRLLVNQIEDFRWSASEREDFTSFVNKYKSDLKKSEDWYELCLSVGKAYWYYGVKDKEESSSANRKERIEQSVKWFEEALKGVKAKDYESALMYSTLGKGYLDLTNYSQGKPTPKVREYAGKLRVFVENAKKNENEIVKIDASEIVFESLNSWSAQFKADGVNQDIVEKIFDDALDLARSLKSQNKNVDNRVKSIMSQADPLIDSIENTFDNSGV